MHCLFGIQSLELDVETRILELLLKPNSRWENPISNCWMLSVKLPFMPDLYKISKAFVHMLRLVVFLMYFWHFQFSDPTKPSIPCRLHSKSKALWCLPCDWPGGEGWPQWSGLRPSLSRVRGTLRGLIPAICFVWYTEEISMNGTFQKKPGHIFSWEGPPLRKLASKDFQCSFDCI